jgi:hypothetical protein
MTVWSVNTSSADAQNVTTLRPPKYTRICFEQKLALPHIHYTLA